MANAGPSSGDRIVGSFLRLSSVFALGLPLAVLTNIVLARILPTAEFGRYGLALAFATVLSIPIVSGMPILLMREVSGYAVDRRWARYRALMAAASGWAILYSLLTIIGFFAFLHLTGAQTIRGLAPDALLTPLLIVPALSGIAIASGALRGFGNAPLAALPQQILLQLLLIGGFLVLARFGDVSARQALHWYLGASVITMLVLVALLRLRAPVDRSAPGFDFSDRHVWLKSYLPFMAIGAVSILTTNLAILLMGFYGLDEGVAHLRVAERGAQLVMFPLNILNTVIGPRVVELWKHRDVEGLRDLAQSSTRMLLLFAAPIAAILILFGRPILGLTFGPDYADTSYWPMVVLVVAQLVFTALGSAGAILAMTGNERVIVFCQIAGLAVLAASAMFLIPHYGAVGAAIGAGAGLLVTKALLVMFVWRHLSFWPGVAMR